jgi:hypothetical protein
MAAQERWGLSQIKQTNVQFLLIDNFTALSAFDNLLS